MIECPCCHYLTFGEEGGYEICDVCFWEDDPLQRDEPSFSGGANVPSLIEARENFQRYGACEKRFVSNVRPPKPDEIP